MGVSNRPASPARISLIQIKDARKACRFFANGTNV
jgi:hypothetical protein